MARLPGLQTATLVSLFALAAAPAALGQTADTPAAPPVTAGPAVLPALKVEGQAPAEFADGPVEGYRATRSATGTKTDTPLKDVPQAVNVVPRSVIEDQQDNRLTDVLQNVSNVQPGSTIGNRAENFTIRGFRGETFARDGVVNNPLFTNETFLDLSNVERVEVLKGPASVLFGQGDPGGLVNIVTKKPQRDFGTSGSLEAGSFDYRRGEADVTGPLDAEGRLTARLTGAYQKSDTFRDFFTESERKAVAPTLQWQPRDTTTLTLGLDYTEQSLPFDRGLVAIGGKVAAIPSDRYLGEEFSRFDSNKLALQAKLEHEVNDWLTIRQVSRIDRGESLRVSADPRSISASGVLARQARIQNDDTDYADFTLDGTARFDTGPFGHTVLLGGEYGRAHRDIDWRTATLGSINIYDPVYGALPGVYGAQTVQTAAVDIYGVYLQDQIALTDTVKLLAGGRFDSFDQVNARNGAETQQSGNAFSPRAGIVWEVLPALSLYASYTESFKPQTGTDVNGSPFDPETGQQYEVGAKADILPDRLSATLAVFNLTRQNVTTDDPNNAGESVATGEQRSRGVELDVTGTVRPGWQVIASGAFLNTEVTRDTAFKGAQLAGAPRWSGSLWSTYKIGDGPLRGLGFGGGMVAVDHRNGALDNSFSVAGYMRVDASVFYDLNDHVRVSVAGKNLFDTDYIETPVSTTEIYAGEPLTVLARLTARY
ncbi:TonB-dependent siderophore receptor [Ferrovibrio xuzhouensis]|uniref:TonB-dependent siderophore receptor n=1 Tax=Ferrovibrio xuzhouensis TaxID=1576914 RepID=A0ABV7VF86_9PROT